MITVLEQTAVKENRRLFPGIIFNFRVRAEESNNSIMVADFEAIPGCEPPRHVHSIEDEVFIIKEGYGTFYPGNEVIEAGPGDVVFFPADVPHHFKIHSEKIVGTMIATPGYIENFFRELSVPYDGDTIPSLEPPTQEQIKHLVAVTESYGMKFV